MVQWCLSEHIEFGPGPRLSTGAMVGVGDQTASQTARVTVLHIEEALVAVGLPVTTTHRFEDGLAQAAAPQEVEPRQTSVHGLLEDVFPKEEDEGVICGITTLSQES